MKLFTFVFGINSYFCTVQFSTTVSKWTHHTWIADCETLSSTSSAPFSSLAPPLFPPPPPPLRSCYLVCIFCFPPVIFGQAGKQPFGALPTPISTMKVNLTHIHPPPPHSPRPLQPATLPSLIQLSAQYHIIFCRFRLVSSPLPALLTSPSLPPFNPFFFLPLLLPLLLPSLLLSFRCYTSVPASLQPSSPHIHLAVQWQ